MVASKGADIRLVLYLMKSFIVSLALLSSVGVTYADEPIIRILAKDVGVGSLSTDKRAAITRRFEIYISNGGAEDFDLSKGCPILASDRNPSAGNSYHVDLIDMELADGMLKPKSSVTGNVGFAAETTDILDAHFVHYLTDCASSSE
jgi:hypothetical protein